MAYAEVIYFGDNRYLPHVVVMESVTGVDAETEFLALKPPSGSLFSAPQPVSLPWGVGVGARVYFYHVGPRSLRCLDLWFHRVDERLQGYTLFLDGRNDLFDLDANLMTSRPPSVVSSWRFSGTRVIMSGFVPAAILRHLRVSPPSRD